MSTFFESERELQKSDYSKKIYNNFKEMDNHLLPYFFSPFMRPVFASPSLFYANFVSQQQHILTETPAQNWESTLKIEEGS